MTTINEKDRVTYNSSGRPWLLNRKGTVKAVNLTHTSALVVFEANDTYGENSEWVGIGALEKVNPKNAVSEARAAVLDNIRDLEKQISVLRSKISKLNYANKALKDMEDDA